GPHLAVDSELGELTGLTGLAADWPVEQWRAQAGAGAGGGEQRTRGGAGRVACEAAEDQRLRGGRDGTAVAPAAPVATPDWPAEPAGPAGLAGPAAGEPQWSP